MRRRRGHDGAAHILPLAFPLAVTRLRLIAQRDIRLPPPLSLPHPSGIRPEETRRRLESQIFQSILGRNLLFQFA